LKKALFETAVLNRALRINIYSMQAIKIQLIINCFYSLHQQENDAIIVLDRLF